MTQIEEAKRLLYEEVYRYNHKRIHSTTHEIPRIRYEKALQTKQTLFKTLAIKQPYQTVEDIFCYRVKRVVNTYRKITLDTLELVVNGVPIRQAVELRISFDSTTQLATLRFWYQDSLVGQQRIKIDDLRKVQF